MGSRYEQKSSKTPKITRLDLQTGLGTTQTPTARKARAGGKGAIPGRTRRGASQDASGVPATSSTESTKAGNRCGGHLAMVAREPLGTWGTQCHSHPGDAG